MTEPRLSPEEYRQVLELIPRILATVHDAPNSIALSALSASLANVIVHSAGEIVDREAHFQRYSRDLVAVATLLFFDLHALGRLPPESSPRLQFSILARLVGRPPAIALAALCHSATQVTLLAYSCEGRQELADSLLEDYFALAKRHSDMLSDMTKRPGYDVAAVEPHHA